MNALFLIPQDETALFVASSKGRADVVEALLNAKANIDLVNSLGIALPRRL